MVYGGQFDNDLIPSRFGSAGALRTVVSIRKVCLQKQSHKDYVDPSLSLSDLQKLWHEYHDLWAASEEQKLLR